MNKKNKNIITEIIYKKASVRTSLISSVFYATYEAKTANNLPLCLLVINVNIVHITANMENISLDDNHIITIYSCTSF